MSLKDIDFGYYYDTSVEGSNPLEEFLEPCLKEAISYDRMSGYFTSRFLARAAEGLADFLEGEGRMRLIMSSQLAPSDFTFLKKALSEGNDFGEIFDGVDLRASEMESLLERHHFEAMCWLMARGRLDLRIVIYQGEETKSHDPIFHPKVGIFADSNGDKVSFSGSINETVSGWLGNVEEFKVFRSWETGTKRFVEADERLFERHWQGTGAGNFVTVTLPKAIQLKMIAEAPEDRPSLRLPKPSSGNRKTPIRHRDYQIEAIQNWCNANYIGILAMATGTGKTKTAKGCIEKVRALGSTITVVTAPFEHIANQWLEELEEFSPVLASSSNKNWESDLLASVSQKRLGRITHFVVVAVQKTAASTRFKRAFLKMNDVFEHSLFVGDEAHGLGAASYISAMDPNFQFRLGLSATPERYFDEIGSEAILSFFGGVIYDFSTKKALAWRDPETGKRALCDYKYYPEFVHLDQLEIDKYNEFSEKIAAAIGASKESGDTGALETLLFQRAAIVKNAASKLGAFEALARSMIDELTFTLVYCNDLNQLTLVGQVLQEMGITYQKITGDESNNPSPRYNGRSERDWILSNFADGTTRVLLAIKCLDEGVDIPNAKLAFILASSGNPREFIQRRGRLLRPSPNKDFAKVYDFVVSPEAGTEVGGDLSPAIFKKELARIEEFADDALNKSEVILKIGRVLIEMGS